LIQITENMEIVNSIYHHPQIWPDIVPDGVEMFDVPYQPNLLYLLVNECDGVIVLHSFRDGYKIHPNFLPEKRGKTAYEAIDQAVRFMFETGANVIYAEIDPKLRHVTRCAVHNQFLLLERNERHLYARRKLNS